MSFDFLASLVLAHGYLVVFCAIALDFAALPIPGELLLLTIGGLAVQGRLGPLWAISAATAGAILADSISSRMGGVGGARGDAAVRRRDRPQRGMRLKDCGR